MKDKGYYESKRQGILQRLQKKEVAYLQAALEFGNEHQILIAEVQEIEAILKDFPTQDVDSKTESV